MRPLLEGFQSTEDVADRFEIQDSRIMKLSSNLAITYAPASRGGHFPSGMSKCNQDAFVAVQSR